MLSIWIIIILVIGMLIFDFDVIVGRNILVVIFIEYNNLNIIIVNKSF